MGTFSLCILEPQAIAHRPDITKRSIYVTGSYTIKHPSGSLLFAFHKINYPAISAVASSR